MRKVKTAIETDRLLLKMPEPGDGAVINASIQRSLNELKPWLGFVQKPPTVEETEINARHVHTKFLLRENLRYLVFLKEEKIFVGSTGFHRINWEVPKFELGYWMDTTHSGKGYMKEAVNALTDYALQELGGARVEIRCDSENTRSRAIPEALGFDFEGTLRNEDVSVDGKRLTDTCIYAKIRT